MGTVSIFVLVSILLLGFITSSQFVFADHVQPTLLGDNVPCPDGLTGFKINDAPFQGLHNIGVFSVFITLTTNPDIAPFDWSLSSHLVEQVHVKAGNAASGGGTNVYVYTPNAVMSDTDLQSPANKQLSHIEFCVELTVGGTGIQIDKTAMLLAGAQMNSAWLIPVIVSGIGFAIVIARKF